MLSRVLLALLLACGLSRASLISQTSLDQCVNVGNPELENQDGSPCQKKLVLSLTVSANQGNAQFIEAKIARAIDATTTKQKTLTLMQPVRIRIQKSPIFVSHSLFQVGYVNFRPHEDVININHRCRDDWYADNNSVPCGFQLDSSGDKIWDSQGFCCRCNRDNKYMWRCSQALKDMEKQIGNAAHCLRFDPIYYYAFGLYPAKLDFNITITIEQLDFSSKGNASEESWREVSTLSIGPAQRTVRSKNYQLKAEYIADFYPDTFMDTGGIVHNYLLIPDAKTITGPRPIREFYLNASHWLLIPKHEFDFSGLTCNKIGVSYSAFRSQTDKQCIQTWGSCLQNQPYHYISWDMKKRKEGRPEEYMARSYGNVYNPESTGNKIHYELKFQTSKKLKSMIVISMVADNLRTVTNLSPARIVESYIEPFEALSAQGLLVVIVQNIGTVTATYEVSVAHCSAGVDYVPAETLVMDPGLSANLSFVIHSFHSVGTINTCEVELYNQNAERLDNMTVQFETFDTCFCHGHCGCVCGDNVTSCPPLPDYENSTELWYGHLEFLNNAANFIKGNFGKFALGGIFIMVLWCMGVCKVLHMVITGKIDYQIFTEPAKVATKIHREICNKIIPEARKACWSEYSRYCLCCFAKLFTTVTREKDYDAHVAETGSGWRRPQYCDGMCKGAKLARRRHRKEMRMKKRMGDKKPETPWFTKKYTCTCTVRDNKPCLEVCTGMCFFFYCPLLPVWWVVEWLWDYGKRKWRRHKRKQRYREMKASQTAEREKTFLMVDQFTRGKVEKQIVDFDKKMKAKKKKKSKKTSKGVSLKSEQDEELSNRESDWSLQSSDTTDADEAGEVDELLKPGYPVYFNYASVSADKVPHSLKDPGQSFSIKGRLMEKNGKFEFDLFEYTVQVKHTPSHGKVHPLTPPQKLKPDQFQQTLDSSTVLVLVTLIPLFSCLNDAPRVQDTAKENNNKNTRQKKRQK